MLRKWFSQIPKGILVIAASWLTFGAYFVWVFVVEENRSEPFWQPSSFLFHLPGVSQEWNVLFSGMIFSFGLGLWLVLIGAPILVGVGLLRRKRSAVVVARHLAIFWILTVVWFFVLFLADSYSRPQADDWSYVILVIGYNLWSWRYLSRESLQEKLHGQELILLRVGSG